MSKFVFGSNSLLKSCPAALVPSSDFKFPGPSLLISLLSIVDTLRLSPLLRIYPAANSTAMVQPQEFTGAGSLAQTNKEIKTHGKVKVGCTVVIEFTL